MGERVYVVRCGKEAGRGLYLLAGGGWTDKQRQAIHWRNCRPGSLARGNRRVVRIVTLSEQLRRAKKRIAELERAITTGGALLRLERSMLGVPGGILDADYDQGRADER
jgi:hypothetical protein